MKIAIVNRHPADVLGGSEMQCDNIATELHRRGHEVRYIAPGGQRSGAYDRSYRVVPTAASGGAIAAAVLNEPPDIVYWRLNKHHLFTAARAIAARKIPIVFAVSHIDDTKLFSYHANPRLGPKQVARAAKQALESAVNSLGFRYVSGVSYLNADYLGLLGIRPEAFVPNSVDETTVRFEWPRPYVAWVANIKKDKRPEAYLALAERLQRHNVDFLMVGALMSISHDAMLEPGRLANFHYLGPMPIAQVNGLLESGLMLVHTCRPEGFGNNFIQAWLKGKPTVSLGFDPGGYIAEHRLGGFADDDFETFVAQVDALIGDPALRAAAGTRARDFARANFSIARTADALERLISDVLAARRA